MTFPPASGPYASFADSPQFRNTRRFDGSLAGAPPIPSGVTGGWTAQKGAALDEAKVEWRAEYGTRTPHGSVHPNSVQRLKSGTVRPYDAGFVNGPHGSRTAKLAEVDPRSLHGVQPGVGVRGVEYYLTDQYSKTGQTYEALGGTAPTVANRYPTVMQREDGLNVVLSGHHRAAAALAQSKPLLARTFSGPVPDRNAR